MISSYQWYFNNGLIAGANSHNYNATQDGDYKVVVQYSSGTRNCLEEAITTVTLSGDGPPVTNQTITECDEDGSGNNVIDLTSVENTIITNSYTN